MATSIFDGPLHVPGTMQAFLAAYFGFPVSDPNQDAGPSLFYQGTGILDPRIVYLKDKVQGYTGVVQAFAEQPQLRSIGQIPAAIGTANIAAAANVVSGTAMTLESATVGVTLNVPIRPFSNSLNGAAPVTAAIALDFGFAFGNCTAASATIQVANSANFIPGMPLVIGGVGNAGGTIALLTQVATIVDATHITVVASAVPLATNATAPIGTGDLWGPSPIGFPMPQAACPFMGAGPGLFLDARQAVSRAVSITGAGGSAGGTFTVRGWDIYGQPMREVVTVGAATIGYGKKCFKYIASVTPNFTDAHNYSVGTSDVFGFAFRSGLWEEADVSWAGTKMTTSTGWLAFDGTDPATTTTGDVRGVIQISTGGGGTGITASASNGSVVSLAMSGRRMEMRQVISPIAMLMATPAAPQTLFGVAQV